MADVWIYVRFFRESAVVSLAFLSFNPSYLLNPNSRNSLGSVSASDCCRCGCGSESALFNTVPSAPRFEIRNKAGARCGACCFRLLRFGRYGCLLQLAIRAGGDPILLIDRDRGIFVVGVVCRLLWVDEPQ